MTDPIRLAQAAFLCVRAHGDQLDKGGRFYALHPLRVGLSLLPDTEAAIVGMLHDVLEDTGISCRELREQFGFDVAEQVECLTRMRHESYTAHLRNVWHHPLATRVKLADIADNLRPERLRAAAANGHDAAQMRKKYERAKAFLEEQ